MYTVLIADDEPIIRRGIKKLVNWEALGFQIIGEAGDGLSTLEFILKNSPQLVLLDIKMPEIDGLEVMRRAREAGFTGKVIILSGYSDFTYAQEALRYNVKSYLTKPVESKLLEKELLLLTKQMEEERSDMLTADLYKKKATDTILKEILSGSCDFSQMNLSDLHLESNCYQAVIYEKYHRSTSEIPYSFSELLRVANKSQNVFYTVMMDDYEVILLKNEFATSKFRDLLLHYQRDMQPQEGSPLDSLFITYGRVVQKPADIQHSYAEAKRLMQRRFFCRRGQHTLGYEALESITPNTFPLNESILAHYAGLFANFLQAGNTGTLSGTMKELVEKLTSSSETTDSVKLFMTDLMLRVKEQLTKALPNELPLPSNSQIINTIREKCYLYEITDYFFEQFQALTKSNCFNTSGSTIDNIVYFIQNNYRDNIRLESIATAFGYNTSYLGQIFSAKMGCSFNTYLDKVRIEKACELLENPTLKVYDIAEMVGYKSVDYFYLKFRKHMQLSPLEYRRSKI